MKAAFKHYSQKHSFPKRFECHNLALNNSKVKPMMRFLTAKDLAGLDL